jgi:hypothetical protein
MNSITNNLFIYILGEIPGIGELIPPAQITNVFVGNDNQWYK